ncbi:P-loop containing nucleoside triphosphate hydrolase protein [Mycena crocata]|nr:P-loop containing nucleoside triphosphate hydrolase protein [Mycena crocata]
MNPMNQNSSSEVHEVYQNAHRAVPVRLLVLGFCRTGTASMRAALTVLGYGPAHHIGRVMANPSEVAAWTAAIDAKYRPVGSQKIRQHAYGGAEWDRLLGEFEVVADVPGILFAEELIHAYPEAKIILTTRDPERWWLSFRDTLLVMLDTRTTRLARWLDPYGFGTFIPFARRNLEIFLGPLDTLSPLRAKSAYAEYYADIRRLVPAERLLEYEVGEGWERLCAFLGTEVPDTPFPHKNDAQMIVEGARRQMWVIYRRAAVRSLGLAVVLGAIAAMCVRGL